MQCTNKLDLQCISRAGNLAISVPAGDLLISSPPAFAEPRHRTLPSTLYCESWLEYGHLDLTDMNLLRSLAAPFYPTSLIFVSFSALLLAFLDRFGLWAAIPAFFLISWLFKYGYVLLEHVANGRFDAPVVSAEMLGPFEARPWVQTALVYCVVAAIRWIGGPLGAALGVAALLLLPASVAVLGVSGQAIAAFNPLALWRMLRGLGWYYLCVLAAIAALCSAALLLWSAPLWSSVRYGLLELAVLSTFSLIGGAVYARRGPLQFEPRSSPERVQDTAAADRHRQRQLMLDRVYQLVNARQSQRAAEPLKSWLSSLDIAYLHEDALIIATTASQWHNARGVTLVLRCLIGELLADGHSAEALHAMRAALAQDPGFTLDCEPHTLLLARYVLTLGQPRLALQILDQYQRHFPDPPLSALAQQLRNELIDR